MKRLSLKKSFFFIFLFVAILPLGLVQTFSYLGIRHALDDDIRKKNEAIAAGSSLMISRTLSSVRELLMSTGVVLQQKAFSGLSSGGEGAFLTKMLLDTGYFLAVEVLDEYGRVKMTVPHNPDTIGSDMSGQPYYWKIREFPAPYWSEVFMSPVTEKPTLTLSVPFREFILVGFLNLDWLNRTVEDFRFGREGYVSIVDDLGTFVASRDREAVSQRINIRNTELFRRAVRERGGSVLFTTEGREVLGSVSYIPDARWAVIVTEPKDEVYSVSSVLYGFFLASFVISAGIAVVTSILTSRAILKPLAVLREKTLELQDARYAPEASIHTYDEMEKVLNAFQAMSLVVKAREERLQEANEEVSESLKEKETLLREVHHRVKNNMQVISSLLNLQKAYLHDPRDAEIFSDSQNRVRSMALVHEKLYQSENLSEIDFFSYLTELAFWIKGTAGRDDVELRVEGDEVRIPLDKAVPCALLVNELISNAFKHAFPSGRAGRVAVLLRSEADKMVRVEISDDGIGLPRDFSMEALNSLGFPLVKALAEQISATLERLPGAGTGFAVKFSLEPPL